MLADCTVGKVKFDMQEGGTVFINFRVQAHPDEKTIARLMVILGQEVHMTLQVDEEAEPGESEDLAA